jgi:flagellar hook-basal body complex protein FliE
MWDIHPIDQGLQYIGQSNGASSQSEPSQSFTKTLQESVQQVDANLKEADHKIQAVNTGQSESLHGVMIAMEKANISLRLMVQMRNKTVDAYKEIMRMQV